MLLLGGLLAGISVNVDNWIGLSSVLRPSQHSIGYKGDGFYKSKDPNNSIKRRQVGDAGSKLMKMTQRSAQISTPVTP